MACSHPQPNLTIVIFTFFFLSTPSSSPLTCSYNPHHTSSFLPSFYATSSYCTSMSTSILTSPSHHYPHLPAQLVQHVLLPVPCLAAPEGGRSAMRSFSCYVRSLSNSHSSSFPPPPPPPCPALTTLTTPAHSYRPFTPPPPTALQYDPLELK